MMNVRIAGLQDIEPCVRLLGILFSQEQEFVPDSTLQKKGLDLIIGNPETGAVFVCEEEGEIAGMISVLATVSTALGARVALLEDMIVAPGHRGKGVGTMLIQHAFRYAESRGYGRITLLTDHDNVQAQRFYQQKGFSRSDMIVLRKLLPSSSSPPSRAE